MVGPQRTAADPPTLPPWTPGTLDIHHIDTGVGNATFILGPDGTTILIDCGATRGGPPASTALRPDSSRSPGEWVARYTLRHARAAKRETLDYMIATHVHPDHVGSPIDGDRRAPEGYVLTGLSDVDALMPAGLVIDRGFPTYDPLPLINAPFAANHLAWLYARVKSGRRVEHVAVGSIRQLRRAVKGCFPSGSSAAMAASGPASEINLAISFRRDRAGRRKPDPKKTTCRSRWSYRSGHSAISQAGILSPTRTTAPSPGWMWRRLSCRRRVASTSPQPIITAISTRVGLASRVPSMRTPTSYRRGMRRTPRWDRYSAC